MKWSVLVRGHVGSLWGGRFAQQGEPPSVDVQSTVQIRGSMLLVNVCVFLRKTEVSVVVPCLSIWTSRKVILSSSFLSFSLTIPMLKE